MARTRDALTADRIVHAALAIADSEGLDALSMRRLGAELGVEAMSLYRHVPNKDALLDGMVDVVVQGWVEADDLVIADWRHRLSAIMHRAHDALVARPWAVELMSTRPRVGSARLRYAEAITSAVLTAGFTPQQAHHALHIIDGTITGFSAQDVRRPTAEALGERVIALYDGELRAEFPAISVTVRERHDHAEEYALMVDLVIDGLDRMRSEGRPPYSGRGNDPPTRS